MKEYSVIRAPDFYTDVDAMRVWLKGQSAIGQDLLCSYPDGWGRPIFIFCLKDIADHGDEMGLAAHVVAVPSGSPAYEAGIRPGDLILAVDGQEVSTDRGLTDIIQRDYRPGDHVQLTLLRDGQKGHVCVRLEGGHVEVGAAAVASLGPTYRLEPVALPARPDRGR